MASIQNYTDSLKTCSKLIHQDIKRKWVTGQKRSHIALTQNNQRLVLYPLLTSHKLKHASPFTSPPRSTDLPSPHSVLLFKDYCALLFSHPHITHNKWAQYFLLSPPLPPPPFFYFFLSLTLSLSLLHSVPMKGRHWAGSGIPKPQASAPLCLAIQHCWEPLV